MTKELVHPLDKCLINMLKEFQPNLSLSAEELLFSLLAQNRRGDTRIALNPLTEAGKEILAENYPEIITTDTQNPEKPFVIENNYLYIQKYFLAKKEILERIPLLFTHTESSVFPHLNAEKATLCKDYNLADKQAEAVVRGVHQNLIITGGPGTGKTTVVFHILRKLLEITPNIKIHLAAPSGKAASRMQESLVQSLQKWNVPTAQIIQKLQGQTIHRLLGYQPQTNTFAYNEKNPLPMDSIFIIDEASMIDISTFASLLKAIPVEARLFLLGDENQLPSVDAGAVLGDLLGHISKHRVHLDQSFRSSKEIAELARQVNLGSIEITGTEPWLIEHPQWDSLINTWIQENFGNDVTTRLQTLSEKLGAMEGRFITQESPLYPLCTEAWKVVTKARILCAERVGSQGSLALNERIREKLGDILMMITKNLYPYALYNGDTGLAFKSADKTMALFQRSNGFEIFSLGIFAEDDWETAFAITIHKSQGSEFENVWVVLPTKPEHPLLTRQILYTGITRAKSGCKIIASRENIKLAAQQKEKRNTGLAD